MNKRTELTTTKAIVVNVLEECPETRNSDDKLYVRVCQRILSEKDVERPFFYILGQRESLGLPAYETVSRCRRRIQEERISLRAKERVRNRRYSNEEIFREEFKKYEG